MQKYQYELANADEDSIIRSSKINNSDGEKMYDVEQQVYQDEIEEPGFENENVDGYQRQASSIRCENSSSSVIEEQSPDY